MVNSKNKFIMKKLFLLVAIAISSVAFSQRIEKGGFQGNAGVGFSSGGWGVPLYIGADYGITDDITIGAQFSYASSTKKYGTASSKGTWLGFGVNGNYHFNNLLKLDNKFDVYAGVTLAYNNFSYSYSGISASVVTSYNFEGNASGIGFAGQIGGRYFFTNRFAVNLEIGGGNIAAGGKVGITYKFN